MIPSLFIPLCFFLSEPLEKKDEKLSLLLPRENRLNGSSTQKAFENTFQEAVQNTVRLVRNGRLIALGTLVHTDGYVLTKASSCVGAREAFLSDGTKYPIRIRKRNEDFDLAMYQLIGEGNVFSSVRWCEDKKTESCSWVVSSSGELDEIRIGITSGKNRRIEREGGVMGVLLKSNGKSEPGVVISEVVPQAAADKVGLLPNDLIVRVEGRKVVSSQQVIDILSDKNPGDAVNVQIKRKGLDLDFKVTLGHRSVTFELFNRNMQMSGPVSKRKDNFAEVFQHDLPLFREDMGGPVFNLNGECIGINIARVDRVTIFSLPSSSAREVLEGFLMK